MSKTEVSLVNARVAGPALKKLVEVVSGAIGRIYTPIDKVLNAYADAKVEKIHAIAKSRLPTEMRVAERVAHVEERRQQNIERIVSSAVLELPATVSKKPVDPDWTSAFFEQCKDIGNEHMRQVWARILASEVANPGSFSRRTLSIVQSMTKDEAESFTRFSSLLFQFDDSTYAFAIPSHEIFRFVRSKITTTREELHLQSIGLLSNTNLFVSHGWDPCPVRYFGKLHSLAVPNVASVRTKKSADSSDWDVEVTPLTGAGNELYPIAGGKPLSEFVKLWRKDYGIPGSRILKAQDRKSVV